MPNAIRFAAPDPGTLKNSAILIVIVLIPGMIASAIGGITASVTVGLCSGAAMSFGTLMRPRAAALTTLLLGAAAAAGALVEGNVWLSGLAVGLAIVLTAPANAYSAGMLMMAPILTMVFAVTDRGWPWWQAGLWGVIGGLVGLGIARGDEVRPAPTPAAVTHVGVAARDRAGHRRRREHRGCRAPRPRPRLLGGRHAHGRPAPGPG